MGLRTLTPVGESLWYSYFPVCGLPTRELLDCLYHVITPPTSWCGLHFVFWSRISFWKFPVLLVEGCSAFGCNFVVFMREVELQSFYSTILIPWRDYLLPISYSCLLCQRLTVGVWVLSYVPLGHMFVFVSVPHCLNYCSFVILSEDWKRYASSLFIFSLKIALAIMGLLWFHKNFWIIHSSSAGKVMGKLIEITLNL